MQRTKIPKWPKRSCIERISTTNSSRKRIEQNVISIWTKFKIDKITTKSAKGCFSDCVRTVSNVRRKYRDEPCLHRRNKLKVHFRPHVYLVAFVAWTTGKRSENEKRKKKISNWQLLNGGLRFRLLSIWWPIKCFKIHIIIRKRKKRFLICFNLKPK